jgi:NADPH:quinone reductase-like Zn-dependent oxidoreductase
VIEAVQVRAYGGPEVLEASELPPRRPGPGQIQVAVAAAGINFIDVYQRWAGPDMRSTPRSFQGWKVQAR